MAKELTIFLAAITKNTKQWGSLRAEIVSRTCNQQHFAVLFQYIIINNNVDNSQQTAKRGIRR